MLADGARVTLGGTVKSHQEGSRFPALPIAGPHLVYEYRVGKDYSGPGMYQDPVFRADELITIDDGAGPLMVVRELYHKEDFNMTLVSQSVTTLHCVKFRVKNAEALQSLYTRQCNIYSQNTRC